MISSQEFMLHHKLMKSCKPELEIAPLKPVIKLMKVSFLKSHNFLKFLKLDIPSLLLETQDVPNLPFGKFCKLLTTSLHAI